MISGRCMKVCATGTNETALHRQRVGRNASRFRQMHQERLLRNTTGGSAARFHPTWVLPATIRCPSGGTRYAVPPYVGFTCDDTVPLWWNPLRGSTLRGFYLRRYGAPLVEPATRFHPTRVLPATIRCPSGGTRYAVPPYAGFTCDDTVPLWWNPLRGSTLRGFFLRRYGAPLVEPATRFHPTRVLPATIRCPYAVLPATIR